MKQTLSLFLAVCAALCLAGCGGGTARSLPASEEPKPVELVVFAAASLTETLEEIAESYRETAPHVTLLYSFGSSGNLMEQIKAGAECDLFLSAASKQMNELDGGMAGTEANPDGLDLIDSASRVDLLENKVVLAVPDGNPKGLTSFDQMGVLLLGGDLFLAVGADSVPVGQYTRKIFAHYGIDESQVASCLTYGSDVKEVTTQIAENMVDGGVIYATDAFSAGLEAVDEATEEMCGRVVYPAAVVSGSRHPEEARAFLEYLKGDAAGAVFESVGFTRLR